MREKIKTASIKKRSLCFSGLFLLLFFLLALVSQPVFANDQNGDAPEIATATTTASLQAITVVQNQWMQIQLSWQAAVEASAHWFDKMIDTMLSDNQVINHRNDNTLAQTQRKAVDDEVRALYSACSVSAATDRKDVDHQTAKNMGAALAQSQKGRAGDATTMVKELQNRCALGLINPNNTGDPDSALYKRLFPSSSCPKPSGAANVQVGADKTIKSVLNPLEYQVPDNFNGVQTDGSYQLLTPPFTGSADHSAFVQAYATCQNLTMAQPVINQSTGAATAGDLVAGKRRSMQSRQTSSDACWAAMAIRMQYSSSNQTPAYDQFGKLTTAYAIQEARCDDDHADNLLTDDQLALCKQNGRSDLQADHDRAFRLSSKSQYNIKVLSTVSADMQDQLKAQAWDAEDKFNTRLANEESSLISAISSDISHLVPGNSPMDAAVQSQSGL